MTIAVAAACPEGALLVTDSMTWRGSEDGGLVGMIAPKPITLQGGTWAASVVVSGSFVGGMRCVEGLARAHLEADFGAAMALLYGDLVEAEELTRTVALVAAGPGFQGEAYFGPDGTSPSLLAIGGEHGQPPSALRITPRGRTGYGFLTVGGWVHVADGHAQQLEAQPVPPTLDAAVDMAVDALRQYIAEHMEGQTLGEYLAVRQRIPGCAGPLDVVRATAHGVTTQQIPE